MNQKLLTLLVAALVVGCAPSWKHGPHDMPFQHTARPKLHTMPKKNAPSDWWDHVQQSTVIPLGKLVSPARYLAAIAGGRSALDINAFGKVPDSTWFENRIGRARRSADELRSGPNRSAGPADGPLTVISGKTEGVSPGLVLRDSDGTVWFVKFDPPAFPELSSGAEIIASKFLYAAGYHVPETFVVDIDLARMGLDPKATTRDRYERKVKLTQDELGVLLTQLNPNPDGTLRALFSRAVPGRPLGPFSYRGSRSDDPNDRLPHERRRSLRGLRVFSAWLNNTDTRRQNTLDTFVSESDDGRLGWVKHYLIDFGDSLGAAGAREKVLSEGHEHRVDWGEIGKRFLGVGLVYPYWFGVRRSPYRGVGIFEGDVFDPERWAPVTPNLAFDQITPSDTFWAAAILARFTPELVAAVVETARYSEEGAEEHVVQVLIARRARLLEYAFEDMLPLDDVEVKRRYVIEMTDLEVLAELVTEPMEYRWSVRWNRTGGSDRRLDGGSVDTPHFDLRDAVTVAMTEHAAGFKKDPYMTLTVHRVGHEANIELHLRVVRDHIVPVALDREVD